MNEAIKTEIRRRAGLPAVAVVLAVGLPSVLAGCGKSTSAPAPAPTPASGFPAPTPASTAAAPPLPTPALVTSVDEESRDWQYVLGMDATTPTLADADNAAGAVATAGPSVGAALVSTSFQDDAGVSQNVTLVLSRARNTGRYRAVIDYGEMFNGCQDTCTVTVRTDVSPAGKAAMVRGADDYHYGVLYPGGADGFARLLARARRIWLELDIAGMGSTVVAFAPARPLVLPLPPPPREED